MTNDSDPKTWRAPRTFKGLLGYMLKAFPGEYTAVECTVTQNGTKNSKAEVKTYVHKSEWVAAGSFQNAWKARVAMSFDKTSPTAEFENAANISDSDLQKMTS